MLKILSTVITMGLFTLDSNANDFVIPQIINDIQIDVEDIGNENLAIITEFSVAGIKREPVKRVHSQRASLDLLYSQYLSEQVKFTFSNRFDYSHLSNGSSATSNALRELYLSYNPKENLEIEVGRINKKFGEALGFNPTDYFKKNSLKTVTSLLPSDLRKNRLGSILVNVKINWEDGALQILHSPEIRLKEKLGNFATDIATTNYQNRSLLSIQHKFTEGLSPELLLMREANNWNIGLNFSALITDSATAYLEFNYTDTVSYVNERTETFDKNSWTEQFTIGTSVTLNESITLVGEFQYDGLASHNLSEALINDIEKINELRHLIASKQGFINKKNLFFSFNLSNIGVDRLSLTALFRTDHTFSSKQVYAGVNYYFEQTDSEVSIYFRRDSGRLFNMVQNRNDVQLNYNVYW